MYDLVWEVCAWRVNEQIQFSFLADKKTLVITPEKKKRKKEESVNHNQYLKIFSFHSSTSKPVIEIGEEGNRLSLFIFMLLLLFIGAFKNDSREPRAVPTRELSAVNWCWEDIFDGVLSLPREGWRSCIGFEVGYSSWFISLFAFNVSNISFKSLIAPYQNIQVRNEMFVLSIFIVKATQQLITCSKPTMETSEQCVKSV